MSTRHFAVGLGANLGARLDQLESAIRLLDRTPGVDVLGVGRPIGTAPVVDDSERERHPPYLNSVLIGATDRGARPLMSRLLAIEAALGRRRRGACDPRTLDLDLVVFEGVRIEECGLVVPHPRLRGRRFVLDPIAAMLETRPDPGTRESKAWRAIEEELSGHLRDHEA